jgi:hypothetical protein
MTLFRHSLQQATDSSCSVSVSCSQIYVAMGYLAARPRHDALQKRMQILPVRGSHGSECTVRNVVFWNVALCESS